MLNVKLNSDEDKISQKMKDIKHKIMVMSNKGGVGKSTVSVNLAYGLSVRGNKVGLLDADIHGPSIVKMLSLEGIPLMADENQEIVPIQKNENLFVVSLGMALESEDTPVIWRGPLKINAMKQFLGDTNWGKLDYLIIDLPPGTGDEALNVAQLLKDNMDGAIIVTTPQEVSLLDVKKAITFVRKMNLDAIGLIVNMSFLICPKCGEKIELYGSLEKVEKAAKDMKIDILGYLPFEPIVVELSDKGIPPISERIKFAKEFDSIIDKLEKIL